MSWKMALLGGREDGMEADAQIAPEAPVEASLPVKVEADGTTYLLAVVDKTRQRALYVYEPCFEKLKEMVVQ